MSKDYTKTIAFQGSFGANSHLACKTYFPNASYQPFESFEDIFEAVESEKIPLGVIPFENSYAGRVSEIHALLQKSNTYIVGEYFLDIRHHLVGLKNAELADIKEVISHPQAILQCRNNIKKHQLKTTSFINTATAATHIAEENNISKAALCTDLAAEINDLRIIAKDFQDCQNNKTIFIALAKEMDEIPQTSEKKITSLLFTVRNIPAAIYKSLGSFASLGINIIKLESYIPGGVSKEAQFFISFEGSTEDKNTQLALEELGFFTKSIKLLGSYDQDPIRYE